MGSSHKRWISVLIVLVFALEMIGLAYHEQEVLAVNGEAEELTGNARELTFWYSDENLSYYFSEAAKAYEEATGTVIQTKLVSGVDYIEQINQASVVTEDGPDVYMAGADSLEKAHLAGLASPNIYVDRYYNETHYPRTALQAVTYQGELVAYPLSFETSCLIYNKTYSENAPATIDDILAFSESFEGADGVENIFTWNVSDIFYDYFFVGNYINLGGECGDDKSQIDMNNDQVREALNYYQNLSQFFAIDPETVCDEDVVQDFIDGKTIFAIVRADDLTKLETAVSVGLTQVNYGIAKVPALTDALQTKPLAVTSSIVVNGYSGDPESAAEFARFLTYDYAANLNPMANRAAARIDVNENNSTLKMVKEIYQDSVGTPKIMELSNYWIQMEIAMANIWKGADTSQELQKVADLMAKQLQ